MGKKQKKSKRREGGKKKRTKRPVSKKYKNYEVKDGKASRKLRSCPKCGPGSFMASHKGRTSCGKCGYTEFTKEK